MRAFAVLMMIQGHTLDALVPASTLSAHPVFYQIWLFFRGLTAPIFLFGSGFAYVIANTRKMQDGPMPTDLIIRRIRWIGTLFLIGMLMHFPAPSLRELSLATREQWVNFFHVDVLRLMAVALMGLLLLFMYARSVEGVFRGALAMALGVIFLSPLMHQVPWQGFVPEYMAGFLSLETGSYFSLFPFAAYLFAGAAAGAFYVLRVKQGTTVALKRWFAVLGASFIVISFSAIALSYDKYSGGLAAYDPFFVFIRLGVVMLLWAVIGLAISRVRRMPAIIPVVGQHTLLIYVLHVVILYGSAWIPGMKWIFGVVFTLPQATAIIVGLYILCAASAWAVHSLKSQRHLLYRTAPWAGAAILGLNLIAR